MVQRRRVVWFWFLYGICFLWVFWGGSCSLALATHETDHRFTVYGSVRDGSAFPGKPLAAKDVTIQDGKTGQLLQRGLTNPQGEYSLLLHVHNSDLGRRVIIKSQGARKVLELQFDPNDSTTERRTRVDLVVFPK